MGPEVLIVLATFQGEPYLKSQLESLLHQDYPNIRLLIRDDLSQDATPQLIRYYQKRFPGKIDVLPSVERLGVVGNFEALMQAAIDKAPYVMFSDQDDCWNLNKVSSTLKLMLEKEQSQPCLVHTDLKVVDNQLNLVDSSFWDYCHLKPQGRETLNRLLVQNVVTGCTVMINQALLKKALPIPKEAIMHDWWLALVASTFGKIIHSKKALIAYRQHSNNQLGAQKFGSLKHLVHQKKKYKHSVKAVFAQAKAFHAKYASELPIETQDLLKDFLWLPHCSAISSPFLLWKRRFYKHGFLRNVFFHLFLKCKS